MEQLDTEIEKRKAENAKLRIVLGMVGDKDIDVVLGLLPKDAVYYFTQPATSRALPAEELLSRYMILQEPCIPLCHAFRSVKDALAAAQKDASKEDIIFIGGSNYVVGEVLA
jgi:dihydrofolate synthase/folylpolyglutamate synthase